MNWDYIMKWAKAAFVRALKTFAQTFAAGITVGALWTEIQWTHALSAAGVAFVYSILTSIAGLPEVEQVPDEFDPPDEEDEFDGE